MGDFFNDSEMTIFWTHFNLHVHTSKGPPAESTACKRKRTKIHYRLGSVLM